MAMMMLQSSVLAVLALQEASALTSADPCVGGDCRPGREECSAEGYQDAPTFHLMDRSCFENDPNGPIFDPVHGVIHHFYQKHVAIKPGGGPVYGHLVSRDFVHWARLPVAVWNGVDVSTGEATPYDTEAIFTGSGTIMPGFAPDGKGDGVVQIYPGICNNISWPNCKTGTLLAVALPADYANDPLLIKWTKPSYNPILENTERDPSTAFQLQSGEWRFITYNKGEYGADSDADVKAGKWYYIGQVPGLPFGECPSMYPLPRATPGFEAAYEAMKATLPTHVFRYSNESAGRTDWTIMGNYVEGERRKPSVVGPAPGFEELYFQQKLMDAGGPAFYAAKDQSYPPPLARFGDPWRRITWGWSVVPPGSTQSLPREVTFNPVLRQLEWAPIEEQDQLRGDVLADLSDFQLGNASAPSALSRDLELRRGAGKQSEVEVVLDMRESQPGKFGVRVMADGTDPKAGALFYIDASKPQRKNLWNEVTVGFELGDQKMEEVLRLAPEEETVSIRVYVDNTFSEAYFQRGRVALTAVTPPSKDAAIILEASAPAVVRSAKVWAVNSIWVSPEEVLRTPRIDRLPQDQRLVV